MRATIRAMLRFVGSVAMVSGGMLVVQAGVTVAWQEPISAVIAARAQASLDAELVDLERREAWERIAQAGGPEEEMLDRLATWHSAHSRDGKAIGRIEMPTLDSDFTIVEGTDLGTLRKGPGHYEDTTFPGQGGTFAVAGHRTTYLAPFRNIDQLERDDPLVIEMPYATFTYRVTTTKVVPPDATWVKDLAGHERLVLTACHPLYSDAKRIVAFATLEQLELAEAIQDAHSRTDS